MLAGSNNVQQSDISDMPENCIPLDTPNLEITFVVSGLNYFHNPGIKIA